MLANIAPHWKTPNSKKKKKKFQSTGICFVCPLVSKCCPGYLKFIVHSAFFSLSGTHFSECNYLSFQPAFLKWSFPFFAVWEISWCSYWVLPGHIRGTLSRRAGGVCVCVCVPKRLPSILSLPKHCVCLFSSAHSRLFLERQICATFPSLHITKAKTGVQKLFLKKQNIILLPPGS